MEFWESSGGEAHKNAEEWFAALDKDGNGELSEEELDALRKVMATQRYEDRCRRKGAPPCKGDGSPMEMEDFQEDAKVWWDKNFACLDDGDRKISLAEWKQKVAAMCFCGAAC